MQCADFHGQADASSEGLELVEAVLTGLEAPQTGSRIIDLEESASESEDEGELFHE